MKTTKGVPLSPRQEKEAAQVQRLAAEFGWEIYSIDTIVNSIALEYRLQSKAVQKNGGRTYHSIRGATNGFTEKQLEALLTGQLQAATLKTEPLPKPMPIKERTPGKYEPVPDTDRRELPDAGN